MSSIQNVAIIGASGNLGQSILPALLSSGFTITAINRPSNHTYTPPPTVHTISAAYDSLPALTTALLNQDALILAFNPSALTHQPTIVRAALAAGVRHLVTSEFGLNTFHPNAAELPVLAAKLAAQRALEAELQDAAAAGKSVLTWTAIFTGAWYDWALARGIFWIDPTARSITRAGSGDQRVSFTRVAVNGEAVVAVLREPERFANRPAYFASHTVSMNKLIEMVGEIDDGGEKWKVVDVPDVEAIRKEGVRLWEKDRREGVDEMLHTLAFRNLAIAATFDEENRFGADFGEKVEAGWDEGSEKLKENLKRLIEEART